MKFKAGKTVKKTVKLRAKSLKGSVIMINLHRLNKKK